MTLLKRKRVFAAKQETTSGTAESLTTAEASFNVYDLMIQQAIEMEPRESQGGFGMLSSIPGGYQGKATFKTDVSWDGTTTMPEWASVLWPACGLVDTSGTFAPVTAVPGSSVKTLTIAGYVDGMLKRIRGAAGTFKLVCPTGKRAYIEWDFTGIWIPPTDTAMLAPTYPTDTALRYANGATTFNSVALCLENITFDMGNEIMLRECAATVSGYHAALITNRIPKVTGNPESKLVATQDRFGQLIASTEAALSWVIPGPADSYITISAPKAQITNIQEADRNRLVTDEIEWSLNRNGSTVDSEFTIVFTEAT
jgi:hypothetical protein